MSINYEITHIYLLVVYMRYVMHMFEIYYYQIPSNNYLIIYFKKIVFYLFLFVF